MANAMSWWQWLLLGLAAERCRPALTRSRPERRRPAVSPLGPQSNGSVIAGYPPSIPPNETLVFVIDAVSIE
jgi:hypothetical protein